MPISKLEINHFRNLTTIDIEVSPQLNIIYGDNGAGKTSFLEALYLLSHGRSFRTTQISNIIQTNATYFSIFARINALPEPIPVGIQRDLSGSRKIRYDGQPLANVSAIAQQLPMQFISTESHRFFHDGPKKRRQFMDWGVFHVEPRFFPLWQDLQQVIKQRNACLKQRANKKELDSWNQQLVALAGPINEFRRQYIASLTDIFNELLPSLLNIELKLSYFRGWDEEKDLLSILHEGYYRELQLGYTCFGPNRADFRVFHQDQPAQNYLSQGQQKMAAYALFLSQGQLMQQLSQKQPIYLIDDLPSELDTQKRKSISDLISTQNAQVFVTGITPHELSNLLSLENAVVFPIDHGSIIPAHSGAH